MQDNHSIYSRCKALLKGGLMAVASGVLVTACADLDLDPTMQVPEKNWYANYTEYLEAANNLLSDAFYPIDDITWSDDMVGRTGTNAFVSGALTSTNATVSSRWTAHYKCITRALKLKAQLDNASARGLKETQIRQLRGEAYFAIGFSYGMLATYWGDVPLYKQEIALDDAYKLARSPKSEVLDYAYSCLDSAALLLPTKYDGIIRPTSGAALAFAMRYALFQGDWQRAADYAKRVMDMNVYQLYTYYTGLFNNPGSSEYIWRLQGDGDHNHSVYIFGNIRNYLSRKSGGYAAFIPTLDLLCAYTCTDGKPIDQSPLYNPKDPFENRDPRLFKCIQPFKTKYSRDYTQYEAAKANGTFGSKYPDYLELGYEYTPNPYATQLYNAISKKMESNTDSKAVSEYASYTGLTMRKYVGLGWANWGNTYGAAYNAYPYLRYAEVLLSYAEAMNEMGKCTQSILDATVNKVRARAYYGTGNNSYPRVMMTTQQEVRKAIRMERRMEFAFESIRYRDLLRWRIADKVFTRPSWVLSRSWSGSPQWNGKTGTESNVTLSDDFKRLLKNWDDGNYPVGGVPPIDEDGIPDLSGMAEKGYIEKLTQPSFDKDKDYLWPIPYDDLLVDKNLKQNPKY